MEARGRLREQEVVAFAEGAIVAVHERLDGKGETVTDPSHLPPTKRLATQEIHRRRVMTIRQAGPRCAEFLQRLRESRLVQGDQVARLARLVETCGESAVERACRRAIFFGATDSATRIERILELGLQDRALPETGECAVERGVDFGRPLGEYGALLTVGEVAR